MLQALSLTWIEPSTTVFLVEDKKAVLQFRKCICQFFCKHSPQVLIESNTKSLSD